MDLGRLMLDRNVIWSNIGPGEKCLNLSSSWIINLVHQDQKINIVFFCNFPGLLKNAMGECRLVGLSTPV